MLPSISLNGENMLIDYFEEVYLMTCVTIQKVIKTNTLVLIETLLFYDFLFPSCVIQLCNILIVQMI